jgi:uncharacterized protein (TIGR03067 family)
MVGPSSQASDLTLQGDLNLLAPNWYGKELFMVVRYFTVLMIVASACMFCGEKNNPVSPPTPAGPTELEGVWSGYSDLDNPPYPVFTYTFAKNTIVVTRDTCTPQGSSACAIERYRGTFVLDTSASPKKIDIRITQSTVSSWVNKTIAAVYYKAANNVNLSANEPGTPRPTATNPPSIDAPLVHLGQ